MPISGPAVHQQLISAHADVQRRLSDARGRDQADAAVRQDLQGRRGDALVRLAETYLPELSPQAIRDTWGEVRVSMSEILSRKNQHQRRLLGDLDELQREQEQREGELVRLNERIDEATGKQAELAERVESTLRQDSEFVELTDRAAIAEAALERAEANLEEIDHDAARKIPAYEESRLFTYLRDRQFGTSEYASRGLTRRIDRWLARLIDYPKARRGYEFLRTTPETMRQVIAEDRSALDTVMKELERMRDESAAQVGLTGQVAEVERLRSQRDELLEALKRSAANTETVQHELTDLEDTRGTYYHEAVELFRSMLQRVSTDRLQQRADRTPTLTDDQIVARLAGIDTEVSELDAAADQRRQRIRGTQSVLDSLGRMITRFRSAGFDVSRCQFDGTLDVLGPLARAENEHDVEAVWQDIRQAQRWGPTAMERVSEIAAHPMTQVLVNAMAHAAGAALRDHARRAGRRGRYRRW